MVSQISGTAQILKERSEIGMLHENPYKFYDDEDEAEEGCPYDFDDEDTEDDIESFIEHIQDRY